MHQLWGEVKRHQPSAALFLLFWLGAWWISLAPVSWLRPDPFLLHFVAVPFAAAALVSWWRPTESATSRLGYAALAGLMMAELAWAIAFSRLLIDVVSRSTYTGLLSPGWAVPMALSGAFTVSFVGTAASLGGWLASSLLTIALRRARQHWADPTQAPVANGS